MTQLPIPRKHRSITSKRLFDNESHDDWTFASNSNLKASSLAKLPNIISKSAIFSSSPESIRPEKNSAHSETMRFRTYRSSRKDQFHSVSCSKLDGQTISNNNQHQFPSVHSKLNAIDLKEISDIRRREIYALNRLMGQLEQEQFRSYCQLHGLPYQFVEKSNY